MLHIAGWNYPAAYGESNQLGFRGKRYGYGNKDFVVLLIGDSQVEARAYAQQYMPENFLEHYLNQSDATKHYKVFSLGCVGWGNDQQLLALKEYFLRYRCDAVVLWQTFGNDVWNNIFPTHWTHLYKPTFCLENGELKRPDYKLGDTVDYSRYKLEQLFKFTFIEELRNPDAVWGKKYLPQPYQLLKNYTGKFSTDNDPDLNPQFPWLKEEDFGRELGIDKNEKSNFSVFFYPRSQRMEYGLELTNKLLNEINALCKKNNSGFLIFNTITKDDPPLPVDNGDSINDVIVYKVGKYFYKSSNTQYYRNMNDADKGFINFKITVDLENPRVGDLDRHLNIQANEEAMRKLTDSLIIYFYQQ